MVHAFSEQCFIKALKEYSKLLCQQEDFWKQKAKQHWLKVVDNNSKYFHVYVSARKRKTEISMLKDNDGNWHDWQHGLGGIIRNYYEQLLHLNEVVCHEVIKSIDSRINIEQNEMLTTNFMIMEVKNAIFLMHPHKSPGPDGIDRKSVV